MNLDTLANQDPSSSDPPDQDSTDLVPGAQLVPDQSPPAPGPDAQIAPDQSQPAPGPDASDEAPLMLDDYLQNGYDYKAPKRGDILSGVIMEISDNGLVVDIGFKREGFVPAEDLSRLDEETRSSLKMGDDVSVFVLRPENRDGHPILSIHQARMYTDWIEAEQMMESGELYEGEVAGFNRGGLIVKYGKIRGFIPASQIVGLPRRLREEQRRKRLEAMIGEQIGLRIIEVDRQRRRLIFSQRRALRAWQELQRERVMSDLVEGETRHGRVTSLTNFGAFVDLGGADGLIHVSELSWSRVDNPRDVLKVGDEVDVYVLDVDKDRRRIALSLKKLQPDPWTIVDDHYQAGELIEGRITRVLDFGAFVELDLGVEGLLHASEMIGTPELNPSDIVHSGEKLLVKIIRIDSRRRRLALSARQVRKDEWERWVAEQQAAREAERKAEEAAALEAAAREAERKAEEAAALEAETKAAEVIETEVTAEETIAPPVEGAASDAVAEAESAEPTEQEALGAEIETADSEMTAEDVAAPEEEKEELEPGTGDAPVASDAVVEAESAEPAEQEALVAETETTDSEMTAEVIEEATQTDEVAAPATSDPGDGDDPAVAEITEVDVAGVDPDTDAD